MAPLLIALQPWGSRVVLICKVEVILLELREMERGECPAYILRGSQLLISFFLDSGFRTFWLL